jgi:hypothetical protein
LSGRAFHCHSIGYKEPQLELREALSNFMAGAGQVLPSYPEGTLSRCALCRHNERANGKNGVLKKRLPRRRQTCFVQPGLD